MAASVQTTAIIVAICGAIIPEPLAKPRMCTSRPPRSTERRATLAWVSVVMIASAAGVAAWAERLDQPREAPG